MPRVADIDESSHAGLAAELQSKLCRHPASTEADYFLILEHGSRLQSAVRYIAVAVHVGMALFFRRPTLTGPVISFAVNS
jgi:hypothetical protein